MKQVITFLLLIYFSTSLFGQSVNLDEKISQFAVENDFNGTVIIRNNNKILYHHSFGLANRELNTPNRNGTRYAIASITKLFTSVLILQLYEEGEIILKNTISNYLPEYKGEGANKVNIHHLLTHTSGIQNCEEIRKDENNLPDIYLEDASTDEIINKYCSGSIEHEVGSNFSYNNGDYIILGKIIEVVTQKSFHQVLGERILSPLKMNNTGLILKSADTINLPKGYSWNEDINSFEKDPPRLFQNYWSSGAMYSTSSDLLKFTDELFGGKLINKSSIELLLRTYPETKSYGYGLWIRYPRYNKTVPKVAQRFGQIWGINTLISHFIDKNITVIVLANTNKIYISRFQDIVGEALLD